MITFAYQDFRLHASVDLYDYPSCCIDLFYVFVLIYLP